MMKTAFVVLSHHSEAFRPFGTASLKTFIDTFKESCQYKCDMVVIDNQSDCDEVKNIAESAGAIYYRIEDQTKGGITGAWNFGIREAVLLGYELIFVCNDDIKFNDSINDMLTAIAEDEEQNLTVYGPLTNDPAYPRQFSESKRESGFVFLDGSDWQETLYGFMFAFTADFYRRFSNSKGDLFYVKHKYSFNDGKWGGQEGMFRLWAEIGAKQKIFTGAHFEHVGCQSWKVVQFVDQKIAGVDLVEVLRRSPDQARMLRENLFKHSRSHLANV